jgi:hypothetical protein
MSTNPTTPEPGTGSMAPCRLMLAAIDAALRIPYPAAEDDEHAYYVLRSKRCGFVLEAVTRVLQNRGSDGLDLIAAADRLHAQLDRLPPDTYAHSGLNL